MAHRITGPRRYAELSNTEPPSQSPFDQKASHQPATQPYTEPYTSTNPYQPVQEPMHTPSTYNTNQPLPQTPSTASTTADVSRRKSAKSRQIDIDKIPRPQINPEATYAPIPYVTNSNTLPPFSFHSYTTVDEGNAGPRFVRSSFYKIPTEENLLNQTQIPLGLIIQPLADLSPDEEAIPVIDYGDEGPLRCNRCRAYVSPNWSFVKNGSYAVCDLCKMPNEVPKEYYCPLDESGLRRDYLEKPELSKGVYEFLAPSSYHLRKLVTPNILFCIEVSSASYLSGIFHQIMNSIQSLLDYIPSPELTKICIATYDTGVNFFKVPNDLTKDVSIMHITDVETSCIPYPASYFFLNLAEERDKINYLIEKIIAHYESSERIQKGVYGTCLGAALIDCCDLLLQDGGRVLAFSTQAPVAGVGKINKRDDFKLQGTEKEKTLYAPQSEEYTTWAKKALEKRVAVDLFCFAQEYFDFATIGQLSGLTGGNLYYYPSYKTAYDGEKLHYDLARNLTRNVAYDAVMTIRTPQGISFESYVTPTGKKTEVEYEFSALDADTVVNTYFKYDEKVTEQHLSFQIAVLYTNPFGQRVIRVINFKTGTANDIVNVFKSCDVETVAQLILKKQFVNLSHAPIQQIRKTLTDSLVNVLHNYRHHCASTSSQSQLILPETLKTLPIYILSAFKNFILRLGGTIKPDERVYDFFRFTKMPLNVFSNLLYPKVYALHTIWTEEDYSPGTVVEERTILPLNVAATDEKIDDNGIYLIDNNEFLYLYVKRQVDPGFFPHLFGVESYQEIAALTSFPDYIESDYFAKVYNIIDQLRKNKNGSYQPVRIVTEKDPSEQLLLSLLVEDERLGESYSVFLCNIHKLIQDKSS